jgi:hypothetical protein
MIQSESSVSLPVTTSPKNHWLAFVWYLVFTEAVFFGLACIVPTRTAPASPVKNQDVGNLVSLGLGFATFFVIVLILTYFVRSQVTATAEGISWRKWCGTQHIRWDQITDYYILAAGANTQQLPVSKKFHVLITTDGKKHTLPRFWSNLEELIQAIQENTTAAKTTLWQILETRIFDPWPKHYKYLGWQTYRYLGFMMTGQALLLVYRFIEPGKTTGYERLSRDYEYFTEIARSSIILFIANLALFFGIYFFPTIGAVCYWCFAFRRRHQRIEATQEGITYHDKSKTVSAPWSEVTNFYATRRRSARWPVFVVETKHGIFNFNNQLGGPVSLPALISERTKQVEWPVSDASVAEDFGDQTSKWNGAVPGQGDRIFHYRNRSMRACIVMLTLLISMFGLIPSIRGIELWPILIALIFITFWWQAYRFTNIRLNAEGIVYSSLFRKVRMRWNEVPPPIAFESLGGTGLEHTSVKAQSLKATIRIWPTITDYYELLASLERQTSNQEIISTEVKGSTERITV